MSSNTYFGLLVLALIIVLTKAHSEEIVEEEPSNVSEEEGEYDSERIAGGVPTTIEKFPYQVVVTVANATLCGGFILKQDWVVTAAHCIDGAFPETIAVRAGSTNLNSGGVVLQASNYVIHSSYNGSVNYDYDFGLIQLNGTLPFSNAIKAIAIPKQDTKLPFLGSITVAGWGLASEGSTVSQTLRVVKVKLVHRTLCKYVYRGNSDVTKRMFCAGRLVFGGKGACQGDVGGAAMYNNLAIGIASFGVACGSPIFPAVFSNVASVTSWIAGVTGIPE